MRTMLFVVGPALGHVGRSLVIARAVRESAPGIRIVFAHIVPGHGDQLLRPEFDCIPIRYQDRGDEHFADQLELIMRRADPALICLDLSPIPWLGLVRFPKIPRVYVTNFFLTSLVSTETSQVRILRKNLDDWNRRRLSRGMPRIVDAKCLYEADAALLCDPVHLIPPDITIAEPYHLANPCVWQPAGSLPAPLESPRRLLLVALGSTGNVRLPEGTVEKIRQALDCDLSVWVRASTSAEEVPKKHSVAYSGVPLSPILQKCALAITQGGAGSTYAALCQGVPVAVWPNLRNHQILGELLSRAGVGTFLTEFADHEPEDIKAIVATMESKSARFAQSWRGGHEGTKAAEILLRLIA